jgi:hypothetical protein
LGKRKLTRRSNGQKTVGCFTPFTILANNFLPLNVALCVHGWSIKLEDALKIALVIPFAIGFLYFAVNSLSNFTKSLAFCSQPFLVRCIPFLIFNKSLFNGNGLIYRKNVGKYLIYSLLSWCLFLIVMVSLNGAWREFV